MAENEKDIDEIMADDFFTAVTALKQMTDEEAEPDAE